MTPEELSKLINNTNALIWGHWNETASQNNQETSTGANPVTYGQSVHMTLAFLDPANLPSYVNDENDVLTSFLGSNVTGNMRAFSAEQQQAALAAFDAWASVANIFRDGTATDGSKTITFAFGRFTDQNTDGATPRATREAATRNDPTLGDVWINRNHQNDSVAPGSLVYEALLHEIGHALGLKHPVRQEPGDEEPYFNDSQLRSNMYSSMVYSRARGGRPPSHFPSTPMLMDIAAIQRLYGANASTNAGNDTYRFETRNGWGTQAVWDAGGIDLIDGSDETSDLVIDLNAGGQSYVKGLLGGRGEQIHIAFTPIGANDQPDVQWLSNYIENAIGGSGDDEITGNDGVNNLQGRGGNDTLVGGLGNDTLAGGEDKDTLQGGAGADTYVYSSGDGKDTIEDSDGGIIEIGGVALTGLAATLIEAAKGRLVWTAEVGGQTLTFTLTDGDVQTGGTLVITGSGWGPDDSITIKNFTNDRFGFALDPQATVKSATVANATMVEGGSNQLVLQLAGVASAGQILRLSVDDLGEYLSGVNGAETLSFENGYIDLVLSEGQTQVILALISHGDPDDDASLEFTATMLDAEGNPVGDAVQVDIDFDAIEEVAPDAPTAFPNVKFGTEDADRIYNETDNDFIEGAPLLVESYGGDDEVVYRLVDAGGSHIVASSGTGQDDVSISALSAWIDAGDDNDIVEAWGALTIEGGAGSDLLFGGELSDGVVRNDRMFANQEITLEAAIAAGETEPGSALLGDLLSNSGEFSNDLLIGSNARDVLAGGGGTDTMVGGAGDDLIVGDSYFYLQFTMPLRIYQSLVWDWQLNVETTETSETYSYQLTNYVEYEVGDENGNSSSTDNWREVGRVGAADTVYAGAGNDAVFVDGGDDFVDAGSGNDVVFGDIGNDTLLGGDGDDLLDGGDEDDLAGADFLDGGAGDDKLFGANGADVLYGGADNDTLVGDDADETLGGADYLNGEGGDDTLIGGALGDTLIGGDGNDSLYGDRSSSPAELQGADYLDGGAGDDTMNGGGGDDVLIGGAGTDVMWGDSPDTQNEAQGEDFIDGGEGDDTIVGAGQADTLFGGSGNDTIDGDSANTDAEIHGDDIIDGGDGDDVLIGSGGNDTLFGSAGNDEVYGDVSGIPESEMGDDYLDGGDGNDVVSGQAGNDIVIGGAGADEVYGGVGDDELAGGEGNDILSGGEGNDVLIGGTGVDTLYGGAGNDTYIFRAGDFQVEGSTAEGIIDTEGVNRVVFLDMASDVFRLVAGAQSGSINFIAEGGTAGLVVRNALSSFIATYEFADGAVYTSSQLIGAFYDGYADRYSTEANAYLFGGIRSDYLQGFGANSILSGGWGNDILVGGSDATSYLFEFGDGQDEITDLSYEATNGAAVNTVRLGAGIRLEDLSLQLINGELSVAIGGAGDALRLTDFDLADLANGRRTIDRFEFEDGSSISWADFIGQSLIAVDGSGASVDGTNNNDLLVGVATDQTLRGMAGNDVLDGAAGNDTLIGGAGNDTYRFGENWGIDVVDLADDSVGSVEVIEFTALADASQLRFYRYDDNLYIKQLGAANSVMVVGYFSGEGIDRIRFSDGSTLETGALVFSDPSTLLTAGADIVYGTQNDDVITTTDSQDVIRGGRGNDTLQGGSMLLGEAGNDTLLGGAGSNTLDGGAGDDQLAGDAGSDILFGGDGIDVLDGGADGDELNGGAGGDTLDGGAGDDVLDGGDDADILIGGEGNDSLAGGAGDDSLSGGAGSDQLDGGAGANRYVFARGDDHDVVVDAYSAIVTIAVVGLTREEMVFRRDGADLVITFESSPGDQLVLSAFFNGETPASSIRLQYGDGLETLLDAAQVRLLTVTGTEGADVLIGYSADDVINTHGGDDIVDAGDGHDIVSGGAGNDQLTGGAGSDQLSGGAGDDLLLGGAGFDTLEGGAGVDRMEGGADDDRYAVAVQWGSDVILDSGGFDTLSFGDVPPADLMLRRDGVDLIVTNRVTGDELRVSGQFSNTAGQAGATALEMFQFGNGPTGMTWDYDTIKLKALEGTADADIIHGHADNDVINAAGGNDNVQASDGDDIVDGGEGNDTLDGGAGNDELSGAAGDDVLYGGAGNNQLSGGDGADALHGGEGNDVLFGGADNDVLDSGMGDDVLHGGDGDDDLSAAVGGIDSLYGDAGNDTLRGQGLLDGGSGDDILEGSGELLGGEGSDTLHGQGFDILRGGAGNDVLEAYSDSGSQGSNTLEGGTGNDTLYGSFGEDTYIFNLGDGHDLVIERRANEAYGNIEATADTLSFGAGIVASDLSFHRRGDDLIVEHANGTDSITVQNWFREPTDHFKLDELRFADGTSLTPAQIENQVVHHGTSGVDQFIGYREANDTMRLADGDDFAWGRVGDDAIYGEGGNDYLEGEAGNDALYGGDGDDQLDGGTGVDQLAGGLGDDKYVYALGDGSDVIDNTGGGNDGVFFIGGIDASRLSFSREGDDLLIRVDGDSAQQVRVLGHFLGGDRAISYVQPEGGFSISAARIGHIVAAQGVPGNFATLIDGTAAGEQLVGYETRDLIRGQGGADTLFGMAGNDQLEGGDGNDYLSGGNGMQANSGDDVLIGGSGDDVLVGEDGNDTLIGGVGDDDYYYRVGNGVDVIDNTGGGFDGAFFIDIARERLTFQRDGDDLVILVDADPNQQLRVTNHFLGGDYAIDFVQPEGGSYLTTAQINQIVAGGNGGYDQVIEGTAAGEQLVGGAGKDLIKGLGGADTLFGLGGDDTLQGGDGDDYLAGGNGSGSGSGADRLEGGAGNDTLTAEDGANVLIGGVGDDSYVHGTGQDTIDNTGGGFDGVFFGSNVAVGNLAFTRTGDDLLITVNGSSTDTVRVTNHFLGGDYALDFVQPGSGNMLDTDAINALVGGGTGNPGGGDQGNDADYPNVVTGTAAGEQLLGSSGRDLIRGLGGNDQLFGFGGDDKFDGGEGDDYISGGNGSFSGSGNDILIGGDGADTLVGEDGDDRLFGGAGDDDYYYQAGSGSDLVYAGGGTDWVFFNGIERTRLAFHQDGNDLIIRVDADASQQVRVADHFLGGEHAIGYVQPGSGFAIPASQIPSLLTPLPAAVMSVASHDDAAVDARAQLDNLIAAMASFSPAETSITEYGPVRTAHYQLVATP